MMAPINRSSIFEGLEQAAVSILLRFHRVGWGNQAAGQRVCVTKGTDECLPMSININIPYYQIISG
jgi:hypothetical protein